MTMRNSWKLRTAVAVAVTAGLVGAGSALARGPGGGCGAGGGGHMLERLEKHVAGAGLPPTVAQAVYQRIDQARTERRSLEASLDAAHEQMHTLMKQGNANVDALMAQADTVGSLETQMHKIGLRAFVEIRAMLTPEQWEALSPKWHHGPPDAPDAKSS
jgi:Spy/CpxP family protein refolding chaperone